MEKEEKLKTYRNICEVLDKTGLEYKEDRDRLTVVSGFRNDETSASLIISVLQDDVQIIGHLLFDVPAAKKQSVLEKLNETNLDLMRGRFCLGELDDDQERGVVMYLLYLSETAAGFNRNTIKEAVTMAVIALIKQNDEIKALVENDC